MKNDATLKQDIIAELNWAPEVNAEHIGVEVIDGIVTLAGNVDSYAEKWHAEAAAQRVSGVKALAIELVVILPGSSNRSDADIARSAENTLEWLVLLNKDSVKVMVEDGWITLSGEVDWDYQKQIATGAVRYLMGVRGVSDQIAIKPKLSVSAVKSDIELALNRRASRDGQKIIVDLNGAVVTLAGTVQSWSERTLACQSAWGSPGVEKVIDNITVTS